MLSTLRRAPPDGSRFFGYQCKSLAHESSLLIMRSSDTKFTRHRKERPVPTWRKQSKFMLSMIIEPAASNPQGLLNFRFPVRWLRMIRIIRTIRLQTHERKFGVNRIFHAFFAIFGPNFRRIYAQKTSNTHILRFLRKTSWGANCPPKTFGVEYKFFCVNSGKTAVVMHKNYSTALRDKYAENTQKIRTITQRLLIIYAWYSEFTLIGITSCFAYFAVIFTHDTQNIRMFTHDTQHDTW